LNVTKKNYYWVTYSGDGCYTPTTCKGDPANLGDDKEAAVSPSPQEVTRLLQAWRQGEDAALVNKAYLWLLGSQKIDWQNWAHFFVISAQLMRHILVDSARPCGYQKRGGGNPKVTLEELRMRLKGAGSF
jgi:hypothetical protein